MNKGAERSESRASSDLGSRPESPALRPAGTSDTGRASMESKRSETTTAHAITSKDDNEPLKIEDVKAQVSPRPSTEQSSRIVADQPASMAPSMMMSIPTIVPPKESSPRQSLDQEPVQVLETTDADQSQNGDATPRDAQEVENELSLLKTTYQEALRDNREEVNSHLERIDALQSKLAYLAQQLATSAKAQSTSSGAEPMDKKLAEKDAQIAALMEEGQKLSKTELKHLTTIKQIRAKMQENNKETTALKQRVAKAEKAVTEQKERANRAEATEKSMQEKMKILDKIEKDIKIITAEREEAGLTITELRKQLQDALSQLDSAEKRAQTGALEMEKKAVASLKEDMENLRIEKKLAEDRAKRELQNTQEEAKNQREKSKLTELELRGEIAVRLLSNCVYLTLTTIVEPGV